MKKLLTNRWFFWLFVGPSIFMVLVFLIVPLGEVFYYSFCKYSLIGKIKWIGFKNYKDLFSDDPLFFTAVKNTTIFTIISFIFQQAFGVIVAAILMNIRMARNLFKNVYYLPVVLSSSALGLMWMFLFDNEKGLNKVLEKFGFKGLYWLNESDSFIGLPMMVICFVALWQFLGQYMMLYIAQMSQINHELYEAANIDGANKMVIFFKIVLPLMKPMFVITSSINIISSLKCFDIVYSMTKGGNGTAVLATLIYDNSFRYFKAGYASAIAVILFIVAAIITIVINYGIKVEDYEY